MKGEHVAVIYGQNVRRIRRLKHMTQGSLAERIDKTVGFISQIERAEANASISTSVAIMKALEIALNELFRGLVEVNDSSADTVMLDIQKLNEAECIFILDIVNMYCRHKNNLKIEN